MNLPVKLNPGKFTGKFTSNFTGKIEKAVKLKKNQIINPLCKKITKNQFTILKQEKNRKQFNQGPKAKFHYQYFH